MRRSNYSKLSLEKEVDWLGKQSKLSILVNFQTRGYRVLLGLKYQTYKAWILTFLFNFFFYLFFFSLNLELGLE